MNWGVSLAHRRPPALDEPLELKRLEAFGALELPGVLLGRLEVTAFLSGKKPDFLSFSRLLDASLTRQAAELDGGLRNNFIEHFYNRAKLSYETGAAMVGVDLDVERSALSPDYRKRAGALLRELYSPWHDEKMLLGLPLRIPQTGASQAEPRRVVEALRDWMLPKLGLVLELHIHELQLDEELKKCLDELKYNTIMLRVIYEPELGNVPASPALGQLAAMLGPFTRRCPVLLTPVHALDETLTREAVRIRELLTAAGVQTGEKKC